MGDAPQKIELTVVDDLVAGSVAGVAILLIGQPFDTLKVRLQTSRKERFRSGMHCLRDTVTKEGFFALYKGMLVPLATVPLLNAVVFASFAQARAALLGQTDRPMTAFESSVAGAWAGFVNSFIASPVELIKNRLQIQYSAADRKYAGPWDCMKKIVAEEGVRGLFRGMNATIIREVPCYAAQFYTYETLKTVIRRRDQVGPLDTSQQLFAGGVAGVACWVASYPQDLVKTVLQVNPRNRFPVHWFFPDGGFISAWRHTVNSSGWIGLWKGFGPCAARAFPANAGGFLAYEFAIDSLKAMHRQ
ncbi:Mitochondrial carrier protein [Plasmodiophora brassicae]|uniref:Mitochondrial carrier protein n=1 Tax=Plasmodiophora brassicae TaxID=37360 RepID=A0A0G4IQP6_PLABS|nr:hypothetical protein PBRA_000839 [Plasmodiophora brassicae]SPQ97805.1 unnamed protein product [Plasmodiophora brassicae]